MADLTIIGAGLAGLMLADRLIDTPIDAAAITVVDAARPTRASDLPGALTHPFPSRSVAGGPAHLRWAKSSVDFLRRIQRRVPNAVRELPIARPLDGEVGQSLRESFGRMKGDYPGWFDAQIYGGDALAEVVPNLAGFGDTLVYRPAFSVDPGRLRAHLHSRCGQAGIEHVPDTRIDGLEKTPNGWRLHGPDGRIDAERVVVAIGWQLGKWYPKLPIDAQGGEVLRVRPPSDASLECIINHSGHLAPLADGTWVAGSTYWPAQHFDRRTDAEAIDELIRRCAPLADALADARTIGVGRGIRAAYRGDNRPLVGPVPDQPGLFVFGAFGSKGLFRIPESADQLANHLVDAAPIGPLASTARVDPAMWT